MNNNYKSIIISGKNLFQNKIYNIDATIKKEDKVLIKGKVNNPDGTPSIGACVEIIELSQEEVVIGYVFTNEKGIFAFSMKYKSNVDYKLNIYGSIN